MKFNKNSKPVKRDAEKTNLMMQDYRIMVEEVMESSEALEAFVKYFSDFSLDELKEHEEYCRQQQEYFLSQKERMGSYVVSKQDPIDLGYISSVIRIIILKGYIVLEENTQKSVEVLKPIIQKECNFENLSDEDLETYRDIKEKRRAYIIAQWIMRTGYFGSVEECEELYDCSTELSLISDEIAKRKTKNKTKSI